jgi:alanine racemase
LIAAADPRRWAWVEVDLGAIAANVGVLAETVSPAALWVVVKADGYGHGAAPVARAALEAGADGLCVAFVQEGAALRQAGILAPILVLSEQPETQLEELMRWHLVATAYSSAYLDALAREARESGGPTVRVHLKVDTGMHRVGARPFEVVPLVHALLAHPQLHWEGLWTHLARADEVHDPTTVSQLAVLDEVVAALEGAGYPPPLVHAANSAGALAWGPAARRDLVRVGIAVYGIAPGPDVAPLCRELEPALSLRARVSHVQRVAAGDGISYGHRTVLDRDTTIATLPLGYADGVPRRLPEVGGQVLLGGRRRPIAGVVTMDQLMVDCGDDEVTRGDEAVLIGVQGTERITADDWAAALGTIAYEVVCGLSPRLPRVYQGEEPEPA